MKYLRIKNNGVIEPQALVLVGASTKRLDRTKIGQFGSGNKYALAYLMRNFYEVSIFGGVNEIVLSTQNQPFRDNNFDVICVNGTPSSITTEMGKDWELWQSIRELYCNAVDEGGCEIDFVQAIHPIEGETHFYIRSTPELIAFISEFDNYFSHNKKVLFECKYGKILEKTGSSANIYRKGIRVFETPKESLYDYDIADIEITEDRIVKYSWQVEEEIWKILFACTEPTIVKTILTNASKDNMIEKEISSISSINASALSDVFKYVLGEMRLCPHSYAGLLKQDEIHNHCIIPTKVFDAVRGHLSDEQVGKGFKLNFTAGGMREVEMTPLWSETLRKALEFLNEVGFTIDYPIKAAIFNSKQIIGCAHKGEIFISDLGFERGVNDLVNTLIEEYIHIKHEVADETRSFQTAVINEFVSYMKKQNAIAI